MTLTDIQEKARSVGIEEPQIQDGRVYYEESFYCGADDEPHDIAWAIHCDHNNDLEKHGLRIIDSDSDNDTVWGTIVEMGE